MAKVRESIVILELLTVSLIGALIYLLFSQGVSWVYVQLIAFLIFIAAFAPLIPEALISGICIVNGKSAVLLGVLAWILLDPLTVRTEIEKFSPQIISKTFLMIIVFLITFHTGYLINRPNFLARLFRKLDYGYSFSRRKLLYSIFICFSVALLPLIIWGGGFKQVIWHLSHGGRFGLPWTRARWGGWTDYFKTICAYCNILCIQLIWLYTIFVKKNVILILIAVFGLWLVFISGTRTMLAVAVLPLFLLYYLRSFHKKKKTKYWIFLFLYLLISIMQLQFIFRQSLHKPLTEIISGSFLQVLKTRPTNFQRDDQFYRMLRIAEFIPDKIPFTGELLVLRPFYHFVPRAIWKNKPQGITWFLERAAQEQGVGLSTFAVSIIGEFYICQGWLGICIAGIFIGFLANQLDSLIEMSARSPAILLIYCYGVALLFVSIRSYQVIYENWYMFIIMYLILSAVRGKGRVQWAA